MKALFNIIDNIKRLNESSILVSVYSKKGIQTFIIDLNRVGQLFEKGVDANEDIIGRYSVTTESLNSSKKAGTPYTLKDTGDFYATFKVKTNDKGDFVISANTVKDNDDLTDKYGDEILGLTKPSLNELIKEVLPEFIKQTRKQIFK